MPAYLRNNTQDGSMKQRVGKEQAGNFRAGYVHIDEEHLHKTGIRGRKVYAVFAIIIALTLVAVVNILITLTILATLRLGHTGAESLEFIPCGRLLRFITHAYLRGDGLLIPGKILSLPNREITITGQQHNKVHLTVTSGNTSFVLGPYDTKLHTDEFAVIDPDSGKTLFSTDYTQFRFPPEMKSIYLAETQTNRVTSDIGDDLSVQSGNELTLRGTEGIMASSQHIELSAGRNIVLHTPDNIILEGQRGPYLSRISDMPLSTETGETVDTPDTTYKVCVCRTGKVFGVPPGSRCDQASEGPHPCQS